jgi:imidazoleglycerol phosphate synthase glutamine amidotransferase subunit HisH
MSVHHTDVLILDVLKSSPQPLTIEEIVGRLPHLGWNQIFLAVDSLSRKGLITLKRQENHYICGFYSTDGDH